MRQDYKENLALAFDTLRNHKLRSFLTVLGVVIGVGVIIIVAALLNGFSSTITDQIKAYGADTAFVSRFDQGPHIGRPPKEVRERKPLTLEDGIAIATDCPSVMENSINIFEWEQTHTVRYQKNQVQGIDFRGSFPNYVDVYENADLRNGRFFSPAENEHRENVAVLGEDTAKALFPTIEDALNRDVQLDGSDFTVIGVFRKPKGGFGENDEDRRVIIPYYTFKKMYAAAYEHGFRFRAYPGKLEKAVDEVREVLRRRRKVPYDKHDTFSIQTQLEAVQQFNDIIGGVALAMVVLSSIGLLIGGVGVMNIMLVSVTERTREIGVRKAIGAKRSDITWQFLFEAMALTGSGGLLGVLFFGGIAMLIPHITTMEASVPLWAVITGLAVSIGVGLVFGVWPAFKAARLDPVEALRYE
ncbi:MAG: ABC transporter permease [Candidatus Acidiferrales bacterium]